MVHAKSKGTALYNKRTVRNYFIEPLYRLLNMENSIFYLNKEKKDVEIWSEHVNASVDYWEKVNGTSFSITKTQYNNRINKYSL